jgi:hypothetical protein
MVYKLEGRRLVKWEGHDPLHLDVPSSYSDDQLLGVAGYERVSAVGQDGIVCLEWWQRKDDKDARLPAYVAMVILDASSYQTFYLADYEELVTILERFSPIVTASIVGMAWEEVGATASDLHNKQQREAKYRYGRPRRLTDEEKAKKASEEERERNELKAAFQKHNETYLR